MGSGQGKQDQEHHCPHITAEGVHLAPPGATHGGESLEGPYGESPLAEDYGNVILFASGIGIAAHLGCIKQLLNTRDQGSTRTQVISLLWEADEIKPWDAAIEMVHKLLDQDADRCDRETPD
ncbi:hypothetical protein B0J14DRAFT_661621 [Halenospora varia]|nr:hypothetical protein B0J14DRAFT_661621 [Halenospora varia]